MSSYYASLFRRQIQSGESVQTAADSIAIAYLDGKPSAQGKHKTTRRTRDEEFWGLAALLEIPATVWKSESMTLALARYFGQETTSNPGLLFRIAQTCPDVICRAVRYSGLVLRQQSVRKLELDLIANQSSPIAEMCSVLSIFDQAHRQRLALLERCRSRLAELNAFEILLYASLYAFEHLVPIDSGRPTAEQSGIPLPDLVWDAVNDILVWKLEVKPEDELILNDSVIAQSISQHISPFLFPSRNGQEPREDLIEAFVALLYAQIELNEFISRSADSFSYDDSIRFVRRGTELAIEEIDQTSSGAWQRDGQKLDMLHQYWLRRAVEMFDTSNMAGKIVGRPENHAQNAAAYVKAIRSQLRLNEVYGVADTLDSPSGEPVNLFQALLSLEMMSALFASDFLAKYKTERQKTGHWASALGGLALSGMANGQNRLPLTWSDRSVKVDRIVGWTVSPAIPNGSGRMAAAILDLWTNDLTQLALRLKSADAGSTPELFERPVLKFGQCLVQLPWVVGMQNNSSAAINNLRRLGARRGEVRAETQRIENNLAELLQSRGFRVTVNWTPEQQYANAGEVDLICLRDRHILVVEVKSTFLRRSQRDAWIHATSTLRKAGQQLQRKVDAVRHAVATDSSLSQALEITSTQPGFSIQGWIVDTSIECDHERFSGFLKISLEELMIALRDERHLLQDADDTHKPEYTLFPSGFTADRLIEVIEGQLVWEGV